MNDTTEQDKATFEKGSWQATLQKSSVLKERSAKASKQAGVYLWDGAISAIEEWQPNADEDVSGEALYNSVLDALGASRKGDASKIKTVALAVARHSLDLHAHANLSKAYAEAVRLTKTVAEQATEDEAAEKAVASLDVPNSTTTVEGAAALLLSRGIDGAVVAILDALGGTNEAAHRSFMRAVATEVSARVQAAKPKPAPKKATPKKGATIAGGSAAAQPKAEVKDGASKPKTKAAPVKKAAPVSASKGDPNKKALPVKKATPVLRKKAAPVKAG